MGLEAAGAAHLRMFTTHSQHTYLPRAQATPSCAIRVRSYTGSSPHAHQLAVLLCLLLLCAAFPPPAPLTPLEPAVPPSPPPSPPPPMPPSEWQLDTSVSAAVATICRPRWLGLRTQPLAYASCLSYELLPEPRA